MVLGFVETRDRKGNKKIANFTTAANPADFKFRK
jgi:hypothetical protein